MRLTNQTDYALRTLMFLAARNRRASTSEVALVFGISIHHVAKIVNQLARMGYIRSHRGVGGGLELARSPASISIGEVIEAFEGRMRLHACVDTDDVCPIQPFCLLKGVFAEAERLQSEYLKSKTLQDILPPLRQLAPAAAP